MPEGRSIFITEANRGSPEQLLLTVAGKSSQIYGIPENKIRKDIKRGLAPGFYSGTWFHVDVEAYLEKLVQQGVSEPEKEI